VPRLRRDSAADPAPRTGSRCAAARVGGDGVRRRRPGRRRGRPRRRRVGDARVGGAMVADREPLGRDLPADDSDQRGRACAVEPRARDRARRRARRARLRAPAGGRRNRRDCVLRPAAPAARAELWRRRSRTACRRARRSCGVGARHREGRVQPELEAARRDRLPAVRHGGAVGLSACGRDRGAGVADGRRVPDRLRLEPDPRPGWRGCARGRHVRRAAPVRPARGADRGGRDPVPRDRAVGADARRHDRVRAAAADDRQRHRRRDHRRPASRSATAGEERGTRRARPARS
jgi:hypothetical protein